MTAPAALTAPDIFRRLNQLLRTDTVHVVGGAVRDRLIGRATYDFDLILPGDAARAAARIAKAFQGSAFPLDEERGIHRVTLSGGICMDVARYQEGNLEDDLDRRDFTVNALAVPLAAWTEKSWKTSIIDRHGGIKDAASGRIRALSKAALIEDPLRLLRAFRFAGELDFKITPETLRWITATRQRIKRPAPERVRDELLRLFGTGRAYPVLNQMEKTGLLDVIFPDAAALRRTAPRYYGKGGVLLHTLDSVRFFEEIIRDLAGWFPGSSRKVADYLKEERAGHSMAAHCVWALLLHDIGKPATARVIDGRLRFFEHEHVGADKIPDLAARFRWSADEATRYAKLVRNHMRPGNLATHENVSDKAIHRFFRDLGDDAVAMLLVSLADHLTYLSPAQRKKRATAHEKLTIQMIRRYYHERSRVIPEKIITGYDVMTTLKLSPSRLIGQLLTEVTEAQAEGKIRTRAEALQFLKKRASTLSPAELGVAKDGA